MSRKILRICTVFMPATSRLKLYNPRQYERVALPKPLPNILRPGMNSSAQASSAGRATTTRPSLLSARRLANIWDSASSRMALPGRGVTIVDTTALSPIPANATAFAPRATRGAWWSRWRTRRTKVTQLDRCDSIFQTGSRPLGSPKPLTFLPSCD